MPRVIAQAKNAESFARAWLAVGGPDARVISSSRRATSRWTIASTGLPTERAPVPVALHVAPGFDQAARAQVRRLMGEELGGDKTERLQRAIALSLGRLRALGALHMRGDAVADVGKLLQRDLTRPRGAHLGEGADDVAHVLPVGEIPERPRLADALAGAADA
jgi:hypothetical protein